ncbi:MAG TPA: exodeoxyribonuclease VII large subunit [Candidatus Saccharimonadales bacterium]|jgi:exodeoxyribonuclease VII large subunit|nr:exodeoxyribonuclease VII large subunit [Candidatus Saccharimonadales bacterium]
MVEHVFSVSDFVAVFNQSISYAYPYVFIEGEIENFKISKNKWVYFSLRDDLASVRFFGTVFQLPGPLEDGLKIRVKGSPFLHPIYGFSINVSQIKPVGEGSIKKAAKLLEAKLKAEGLFDLSRKRLIEYPVYSIGLITSVGSAAYHDFIKIISERWGGLDIRVQDVQVQGDMAASQIIKALDFFNTSPHSVDVIVIIRGGGSAEDLSSFNEEYLIRSIASSRIPSLVAIGHEVDISLAELVADRRCSTPTHAAETLTPDKRDILNELKRTTLQLDNLVDDYNDYAMQFIDDSKNSLAEKISRIFDQEMKYIKESISLLSALNPIEILKRGYAIVRRNGKNINSKLIKTDDKLTIETYYNNIEVVVKSLRIKDNN